jgi:hypothetical protein
VARHFSQQIPKRLPLRRAEPIQQVIFGVPYSALEVGEHFDPVAGGNDLPLPPVGRIEPALHKTGGDQIVDQVCHHRPVDAQIRRQRQLIRLFAMRDGRQGLVAARTMWEIAEDGADSRVVSAKQNS